MPTPLHSLLPVHKSRSATMVTAPPVHPAQTSAQPLIDNVRHKRGAEPDQGNVQPGLLSQRDGIAASETTPKYCRTTEENAGQTADDRPRFNGVQDRPVFFSRQLGMVPPRSTLCPNSTTGGIYHATGKYLHWPIRQRDTNRRNPWHDGRHHPSCPNWPDRETPCRHRTYRRKTNH